jgi:hypothetical protein
MTAAFDFWAEWYWSRPQFAGAYWSEVLELAFFGDGGGPDRIEPGHPERKHRYRDEQEYLEHEDYYSWVQAHRAHITRGRDQVIVDLPLEIVVPILPEPEWPIVLPAPVLPLPLRRGGLAPKESDDEIQMLATAMVFVLDEEREARRPRVIVPMARRAGLPEGEEVELLLTAMMLMDELEAA